MNLNLGWTNQDEGSDERPGPRGDPRQLPDDAGRHMGIGGGGDVSSLFLGGWIPFSNYLAANRGKPITSASNSGTDLDKALLATSGFQASGSSRRQDLPADPGPGGDGGGNVSGGLHQSDAGRAFKFNSFL